MKPRNDIMTSLKGIIQIFVFFIFGMCDVQCEVSGALSGGPSLRHIEPRTSVRVGCDKNNCLYPTANFKSSFMIQQWVCNV